MPTPSRIAIIGGGAAGLMCAATILEYGKDNDIHLFEKNNRLGAKVIISGGGRCNVTTETHKRKELLTHYPRGADFLDVAFRQFGPRKVRQRFEDHGVPLKQEDDGRIFPVSDNGKDIVGVFEKLFTDHDVHLHFKEPVTHVEKQVDTDFLVHTEKDTYSFDIIVLATGGQAFKHTGSAGDGYAFAQSLGHTITELGPSLNSFHCKETWIHSCSGISFPNACCTSHGLDSTPPAPVLLTHFGITGPHVFAFAAEIAFEEVSTDQPYSIHLVPDASLNGQGRNSLLLEAEKASPKKSITTILGQHLPKRFVEHFLAEIEISAHQKIGLLRKHDRECIATLLGSGIPLTLTKRRPGDEFVTAGGVPTNEVNPQTMESNITPGCYIIGELLNVDGVTGGYNLQASWAAGYLAGKSIVNEETK